MMLHLSMGMQALEGARFLNQILDALDRGVAINMFRMGPTAPGVSIFFSKGQIMIHLHH